MEPDTFEGLLRFAGIFLISLPIVFLLPMWGKFSVIIGFILWFFARRS